MWIVSKYGLINTDNVVCIGSEGSATIAIGVDGKLRFIADKPVVADILVGLQTDRKFLEVQ